MLAKAKRNVQVVTADGRTYNLAKDQEYRFHYRNDDAVIFMDKFGFEIIYTRNEFDEDFEISRI